MAPTVNLSNGGSSKQARAVIDGLETDVVAMNQETDIDDVFGGWDAAQKAHFTDGGYFDQIYQVK